MATNNSVTIKSLNVRTVILPMIEPHKTASGVVSESPLVLVDIETSDGVTGHGLIFTYTSAALKPTADLIRNIEALIIGEVLAPVEIELMLKKKFRLLGAQGLMGMALAAIDMALWDALSRTHNCSLVSMLGGIEKSIQSYGAVGYNGEKGSAVVAERWAKKGFKGIKAKIGYPTVQEDVTVIQAMRRAIGDDVAIMVDYNQSLTPVEAIERLKVIESEGLTWIEEPTLAHDYQGHAQITRDSNIPIQCGENWWGPQDVQHGIDAKASDYIMLDVMKVGGVTGWMKASAMSEMKGIKISSHLWPEISARLLSCSPTMHWLEYCDWWNPIIKNPLQIENGFTVIDSSIGSGVEWDEDVVSEHLV